MPSAKFGDLRDLIIRGLDLNDDEARTFLERITPTVEVADLLDPLFSDARGVRLAYGAEGVSQVAGQYAHVQLLNPTGSGVLIAAASVHVSRWNTAGSVYVGEQDAAFGTLAAQIGWRDRRVTGSPAGQVRGGTNAARQVTNRLLWQAPTPLEVFPIELDVILDEGQGVGSVADTVNEGMAANYYWLEINKS